MEAGSVLPTTETGRCSLFGAAFNRNAAQTNATHRRS